MVVDSIRPLTETDISKTEAMPAPQPEKKLFVKLAGAECGQYERLKLILTMFPGGQQMAIHFEDTKKTVGAKCLIHDALIRELKEMLGDGNVIVK